MVTRPRCLVNPSEKALVKGAENRHMAKAAQGSSGTCVTYMKGVHDKLQELGISDPAVSEFWSAVSHE